MKWIFVLRHFLIFGVPWLLLASPLKGEIKHKEAFASSLTESGNVAKNQQLNHVRIENLTTEALTDTKDEFKAIFFDYQSQETLGHLYWNQLDAKGIMYFQYAGEHRQIEVQISDTKSLGASERFNALLRGLHEAGIAWISQLKARFSPNITRSSQPELSTLLKSMLRRPTGYFEKVNPQYAKVYGNNPTSITRVATGWAIDLDRPKKSSWIHLYTKNTSHISHLTPVAMVYANLYRPDINRAKDITGNHGWKFTIPEAWDADSYQDNTDCELKAIDDQGEYRVMCDKAFYAFIIDTTHDHYKRLANTPILINYQRTYWR
jgi:hypothetical protein